MRKLAVSLCSAATDSAVAASEYTPYCYGGFTSKRQRSSCHWSISFHKTKTISAIYIYFFFFLPPRFDVFSFSVYMYVTVDRGKFFFFFYLEHLWRNEWQSRMSAEVPYNKTVFCNLSKLSLIYSS